MVVGDEVVEPVRGDVDAVSLVSTTRFNEDAARQRLVNGSRTTEGSFVSRRGRYAMTAAVTKHVFELYDRTGTTFKVRGCQGKEVAIAGAWLTITAGTGSKALAADITITATSWVWIAVTRAEDSGTATLNFAAAASMPASDDDTEIYPIAYVPFADAVITWLDVIQARSSTIHWLAE